MMNAPRKAYAARMIRLRPDPLQLAATLLQGLERPAPVYRTLESRGTALAVRRYGLGRTSISLGVPGKRR